MSSPRAVALRERILVATRLRRRARDGLQPRAGPDHPRLSPRAPL